MKKNNLNNAGQVALIVLIISAIIMTLGLSISKKSVVETKITTDEELLKQAFNTAESGIDYYLGTGLKEYTNAKVNVAEVGTEQEGTASVANMNVLTLANELSFTWLVPHNDDGSINLDGTAFNPVTFNMCVDVGFTGAVKIDYFYKIGNEYGVKRLGYNLGETVTVNGFVLLEEEFGGACPGVAGSRAFSIYTILGAGEKPLLLVVKPIGGGTKIAFVAYDAVFPKQAEEISSLGQAGEVSRNVKVINQYQLPSFLLEAVTASGDVLSN